MTTRIKRIAALCLLFCSALVYRSAAAEEAPGRLPDETLMQYYDHSLFVGDSVVRIFRNYVKELQKENPAAFSGIAFYSAYNFHMNTMTRENIGGADDVQLSYKGRDATLREIMQKENPEKVFIMIGLNDRIYSHVDRAEMYIDRLIKLRDTYVPDVQLAFFSLTPVTRAVGKWSRDMIDEYNVWLAEKCAACGMLYIDIASGIRNEDGWLPDNMSTDGEYHMNNYGNALWAQALLDFAQEQYEAGLWTPETAGEN